MKITIIHHNLGSQSVLIGLFVIMFSSSCDNDDVVVRIDPETVATSNIVAYFPFDREPAGGAAVEYSGETIRYVRKIGNGSFVAGRNGNAYQGSYTQSCLEFDVAKVSIFTTLEDFTLACWLKTTTTPGSSKIFGMDGGDSLMGNLSLTRESRPENDSVELELYFFDDSSQSGNDHELGVTRPEFMDNEWFHLAALYRKDSSTMEFYVNGKLITKQVNYSGQDTADNNHTLLGEISFRNDISKLYFGAWQQQLAGVPDPWMSYYDGLIDEFRIYNKALSEVELFNLYEAELSQVEE